MPIHDWTRVSAGKFHAFHLGWIAEMQRVLNGGVLPGGYDALAEQVANQVIPDVLTWQDASAEEGDPSDTDLQDGTDGGGMGVAVAEAPPRVAMREVISEAMLLAARRRRLVIRHATGDRIVAFVEIVSPGNKERQGSLDSFVDKAVGALNANYHLLVMDLFPPGPFDPTGIHGAIWQHLGGSYEPPAGKPLTLAGYAAEGTVTCYVEPTNVGEKLIPMPLFLDPEHLCQRAAGGDVPCRV